jgi:hypothetical protein
MINRSSMGTGSGIFLVFGYAGYRSLRRVLVYVPVRRRVGRGAAIPVRRQPPRDPGLRREHRREGRRSASRGSGHRLGAPVGVWRSDLTTPYDACRGVRPLWGSRTPFEERAMSLGSSRLILPQCPGGVRRAHASQPGRDYPTDRPCDRSMDRPAERWHWRAWPGRSVRVSCSRVILEPPKEWQAVHTSSRHWCELTRDAGPV